MGKKFRHLTYTDRLIVEKMYNNGSCKTEIARILGCCVATVYNEIKRGLYIHKDYMWRDIKRYSAKIAQDDYDSKATTKGAPLKIGNDYNLAKYIEHKIIVEKYSPDALLNEMPRKPFCTTTLYSYIDKGVFLHLTNKDLPEKSLRKRKYTKIRKAARPPKGISIERRPSIVLSRETFGHWEMDCVIGKAKGKGQALLVLTERLSRYEMIFPLKDKTASSVVHVLDKLDKTIDFRSVFKSITVDNGAEFSNCYDMEHSRNGVKRTTLYYCHPYCSSERGSNERMNRMVRRFFPKGKDLSKTTTKECFKAAKWLNNYPRKILGYRTPAQVASQYADFDKLIS